ncbi:MAG: ferric reductase-like transmembrane domain-containing protein [Planctomycetes bacterium]|nr:ferric reductase-like transmembrane domain-containing protein [Planctomycetota bacterium]
MRSLAWFAVFAVAVVGPLTAAWFARSAAWRDFPTGFGAALGWIAFGLFAVEFALVSRVRAAAAAFGSDALLLFHRAMALAALAFVVAHVALLAPSLPNPLAAAPLERSGAIALWAAVLLIVSSVWRRKLGWSYELWLAAHRALAVTIVVSMAWHVWILLEPEQRSGKLAVLAYAALALAALLVQRIVRPLLQLRRPWELVENRDEGASTRTLVLRAVGHDGLRFAPGQFVWLSTGRRGLCAPEHPITVASSPELEGGRTIELAIKALGDWSRDVVPALQPGARLRIDGPFGAFTPDGVPAQQLVLIAGGVGVTPMRSILLAMRDRCDRRAVTLFFAAHSRARAMFAAEFERLRDDLNLELVFVFEAPEDGTAVERGFLTAEILRRHLPADLRFAQFFVCGPAPMMDAVDRVLTELGVRSSQVRTERFDLV